jgi:hypothetical protein
MSPPKVMLICRGRAIVTVPGWLGPSPYICERLFWVKEACTAETSL